MDNNKAWKEFGVLRMGEGCHHMEELIGGCPHSLLGELVLAKYFARPLQGHVVWKAVGTPIVSS